MSGKPPPLIILCGAENTLSIVRSMSKKGIQVSVIALPTCMALHSRYLHEGFEIPKDILPKDYFRKVLLGNNGKKFHGSVLFACGDNGIEFIIEHHKELSDHYILDIQKPELQKALLDKQETLRLAEKAGIGFPQFWNIDSLKDIDAIADKIHYPAIIKPIHSHRFVKIFGAKLLQVNNADELIRKAGIVTEKGLEYMVSEMIPGPDSLLSSYYTHIDHEGHALFKLTKRIIRRMPTNYGGACCHATEWLPETAEKGEHFFRSIGFTGIANIEFKRDPRDGQLKIIECNARYTAAQELVTRSGIDIAYLIYQFLINQNRETQIHQQETITQYRENLYYWYPREDFKAFLSLLSERKLNIFQWLKSIAHLPLVFPYWSINDPKPSIISFWRTLKKRRFFIKPYQHPVYRKSDLH